MQIYPAIDLYNGNAVRLFKGDYDQMTVYSTRPLEIAKDFECCGAEFLHMVDLEGARDGGTPNIETVKNIARNTELFTEIGGGIRNMDVVDTYLEAGVDRVILGTAAVKDEAFLKESVKRYEERIAVGVDIRDGYVAIKGWLEKTENEVFSFCEKMMKTGVKTLICTDISKDGAMQGTNLELYRELQNRFDLNIIASGGVSSIDDVRKLAAMDMYGAIIGKAYYTGAIDLKEAIEAAG